MGKKLTYEFVKASFAEEGYVLLSTGYKNNHSELKYRCPKGHRHEITWVNWYSSKNRCPSCYGNSKPTIETVSKCFSSEGYTLLSKCYKNNRTKLSCVCPKGHTYTTSWGNWSLGSRCTICSGRAVYKIEHVAASFSSEGYILLESSYKNNATKMRCRCPEGHEFSTTFGNWLSGSRCPYCSNCVKLNYEFVKESFESEGYKLLSSYYTNVATKLDYVCPNGHTHSIRFSDWQNGVRCPYCYGNVRLTLEAIRYSFEKEGYELLSYNYINNVTELKYRCTMGHINITTMRKWTSGYRCPDCHRLSRFGDGNPSWKGGISLEPYCEVWKDKEYKKDIRDRDGNKCLNPCCFLNDSMLSIHHIDYNKKNCHPNNLITVCRSCNSRANYNRKWHKAWYQAIMYRRYGYTY